MRIPGEKTLVWINGKVMPMKEAALPLADPVVQAGLGVFETLAVRDGEVLDIPAHLQRLRAGAAILSVELPTDENLLQALRPVVESLPACAWVKILAGRSGLLSVFGAGMDPQEEEQESSAVLLNWRLSHKGPIAGLKTLNYAHFLLGTEEAIARGADEGIWLNTRGHLGEGCSSNLVVVQRETLYTAGLGDGILPGIVRDLAIRAARNEGYSVHEGKVRLKRLEHAEEAFLTSSLRGVRPLVRYQGKPLGKGVRGPVTTRIARAVAAMRHRTRPAEFVDQNTRSI